MTIIPHQDDERFTFEDFDFMCAVIAGRDRLISGKTLQTGTESQKKLLSNGAIFLLLGAAIYIINKSFAYVFFGFGIVFLLITASLFIMTRYSYQKVLKEGEIKGDIVFDESGIHVWENDKKGFDAAWDELQYCFISKLRIVILFRKEYLVIDMPYTPSNKDYVIQALKEGQKLSVVKLLDYEKGKISIRNI